MSSRLRYFELWILKFLSFFAGCLLCFLLQSQLGWGAVVAAAFTGLVGTFLPETKRIDGTHVHANIYMGAFVAMGSKVVEAGIAELFFVSVFGCTIYFLLTSYFKGLGGKLGLIAFISSLMGIAMRLWL